MVLGGIVFPIAVLTPLLGYGLWLTRAGAVTASDVQEITVSGERWWWRVTYSDAQLRARSQSYSQNLSQSGPFKSTFARST